jgi:ribosomal protein L6P/L9E
MALLTTKKKSARRMSIQGISKNKLTQVVGNMQHQTDLHGTDGAKAFLYSEGN